MNRLIREVSEDELDEVVRIGVEAFPGMGVATTADRENLRRRAAMLRSQPAVHAYGLFEDGQLLGSMRLHDFTMQLLSTPTLVGGIGAVAVDLRHKKKGVAADMIRFFHDHYREQGACLTALYPFRPDFYRMMGYGYGTRLNRYAFRPDALPPNRKKDHIDFLTGDDKTAIVACYNRAISRSNGLMELLPHVVDFMFSDPGYYFVGYRSKAGLEGFMHFKFEPAGDNWLHNNLVIRYLIYDNPQVLGELLAFLYTQADQVDRIVYETQDEDFFHLLSDPRDGSGKVARGLFHESNTQGVGIMYRVIDVGRLFDVLAGHDFNGQTCTVGLKLDDSFLPENDGHYTLVVENGEARLDKNAGPDVVVAMGISQFSSLVTGAIGFGALYELGLAQISDTAAVGQLDRLFRAEQKPVCLTNF